jgi:hypothetical protein
MSHKKCVPQTISLLQINLSECCGCWTLKLESSFPSHNIHCCFSVYQRNGVQRTKEKNNWQKDVQCIHQLWVFCWFQKTGSRATRSHKLSVKPIMPVRSFFYWDWLCVHLVIRIGIIPGPSYCMEDDRQNWMVILI